MKMVSVSILLLMKGTNRLQESQGIYKSVTESTSTKMISSCTKSEGLIKF